MRFFFLTRTESYMYLHFMWIQPNQFNSDINTYSMPVWVNYEEFFSFSIMAEIEVIVDMA